MAGFPLARVVATKQPQPRDQRPQWIAQKGQSAMEGGSCQGGFKRGCRHALFMSPIGPIGLMKDPTGP
jgi:hypothetical protein